MLTREQAEKRLGEFRVEDWADQRLTRLARLPADACELGRAMLDPLSPRIWGSFARHDQQDALEKCSAHLERLTTAERRDLVGSLFPKLVEHIERGWRMVASQTYQSDLSRKAFRAPTYDELVHGRRLTWLLGLIHNLKGYDPDIAWLAAWTPHLGYFLSDLSLLLAAAIDACGTEGEQIFQILVDSANGVHDVGQMGHHVVESLLMAGRTDGWEFIEKLLVAAQRQEGLRQSILERADVAHPQAFRRILRVILEHGLARFSATVRALNVWLGYQWDAVSVGKVNAVIEKLLLFLEDDAARMKALDDGDAEDAYLALWTIAHTDAMQAIPIAAKLLKDTSVERRIVGSHMLAMLDLEEAAAALLPALDDKDLRVAARALSAFGPGAEEYVLPTDLFAALERLIARAPPRKKKLPAIVWPWFQLEVAQVEVARTMRFAVAGQAPKLLIPHLRAMDLYNRAATVEKIAEQETWDADTRKTILAMLSDASARVREESLKAMNGRTIEPAEAPELESLLTRKAPDLRRGVVTLLLGQPDEAALGSADRLLASADDLQRLGGLEMLRRMAEDQRQADSCRDRARVYRNARAELTKDEALQLEGWLERAAPVATLDDGLGLFDPLQRTRPAAPKCCDVAYVTAAALACLKSIDGLINEHRETHVKIEWGDTSKEGLMGNVSWGFPRPDPERPLSEDLERLPLRQVWEGWWKERGAEYRDADGAELMRARWCLQQIQRRANRMLPAWLSAIGDAMLGAEEKTSVARAEKRLRALGGTENEGPRLNFAGQIGVILPWLMRLAADRAPGFLLDGLEHAFGLIPEQHRAELGESHWYPGELLWRNYGSPLHEWLELIRDHRRLCAASWQPVHTRRLWCLLRWFDEPGVPAPRCRPSLDIVMGAWRTGAANEADVLDQLIGPRLLARYGRHFGDLAELSGSKDTPEIQACPELKPLIDRCRARIIEVELTRGEAPTAASAPAMSLRSSGGIDVLFPLLRALGRERIARSAGTDNLSKAAVFSHLIGVSMPREADTPQSFAAQAAAVEVEQDQLIDLAIFAPQWASHVEHTIGWPCVADAVWWLHAHTKDKGWRVDEDIREKWKAQIGLLTPLSGEDLLDGAVDVAWFQRFYPKLGAQRWVALDKSAKYTCGGTGHTRARLFAAAMLGNTDKSDLMKRMRDKRQQDAVRALGLPPLASGKAREADLLDRYRAIQEFVRTGRKLGSQRQASEKRAAAIGMDNLARTAGYPDPIRLQWAMEARESADLAKGPIQVKSGDVVVSLSLDEEGAPELAVSRKGKPLASVPASVKKNAQIQELQERKTEMKRAASRTRLSLEQAMIRGDAFRGPELRELSANPVRSPMLGRLVFVNGEAMGYPIKGGLGLEDHAGKVEPIGSSDGLRLAHPHDLLTRGDWSAWQRDCFARERVQPFKQVFRELYVLTKAERDEGSMSRRYAGHQVQPRQALALLGARTWLVVPDEGVSRTFHEIGLTAWLTFANPFFTPADVEGLTLEGVFVAKRGEQKVIQLADVPPRLFSEVMRDLDLVVSVAHRGGVDPEASASTVEMRASLLQETCKLLKLDGVRIQDNHAMVDGKLGRYTVHLGSAVAHRQPGGALFVVAVQSQHRGRLFLPFADDDPKTAEVVSKVLLLARDDEIKDPSILAQMRG